MHPGFFFFIVAVGVSGSGDGFGGDGEYDITKGKHVEDEDEWTRKKAGMVILMKVSLLSHIPRLSYINAMGQYLVQKF